MDQIFDLELATTRRRRAFQAPGEPADFLLKNVGEELAARLSIVERHFESAIEIGGHNGAATPFFRATGKIEKLVRLESFELLSGAEDFVFGTDERLPIAPHSQNLIVVPLSFHVSNDTPGLFVQACRSLKPDGLFLAAIPAGDTLIELRDVMLEAEVELTGGATPRVHPFADVREYGALLQRGGFALPVADTERLTVRYDTMYHLMRDLRAMGMTNVMTTRSKKPTSRRLFLRAAELYHQKYADQDGRVRATFEIVYLSGWVPDASQQKPLKPGSAKMRLADALKPAKPE